MRRALLAALAFAGAFASVPAGAAESDTGSVDIGGTVANLCVLGAPNPNSVDLGQLADTSGATAGHLTALAERTIVLPASFCNYAGTQISISASALVAAGVSDVETGFSRAVNYTAVVATWAATPATATTGATANGANPAANATGGVLDAPKQTDLTLTLSNFTAPGNGLLVSGSYSGAVTVTLGPSAAP